MNVNESNKYVRTPIPKRITEVKLVDKIIQEKLKNTEFKLKPRSKTI